MIERLALGLLIFLGSAFLGRTLLLADLGWKSPWNYPVEWVFGFPFMLYFEIYPLLRKPGYDDIQYGECLVPNCDMWSILIAALISVALYYFLAHIILSIHHRRSRRRGA
jgi:hypothetical protein